MNVYLNMNKGLICTLLLNIIYSFSAYVQETRREEKVIHVRFNDGHAHKILHHQADNGNERGREENGRKGRFVVSTCMFSSCKNEEKN